MPKTYCPNCDEEFSIGNPRLGAFVSCKDCGADLEVISVNPLEVDFPLDSYDDEDLDDDDEQRNLQTIPSPSFECSGASPDAVPQAVSHRNRGSDVARQPGCAAAWLPRVLRTWPRARHTQNMNLRVQEVMDGNEH